MGLQHGTVALIERRVPYWYSTSSINQLVVEILS